jgi:hypothetical protein
MLLIYTVYQAKYILFGYHSHVGGFVSSLSSDLKMTTIQYKRTAIIRAKIIIPYGMTGLLVASKDFAGMFPLQFASGGNFRRVDGQENHFEKRRSCSFVFCGEIAGMF